MKIWGTESNEEIRKELGQRIKDMRRKKGIRQKDIAARIDMSAETIGRIERGENVRVDHLLDMLRELDLLKNIDDLVPQQEVLVFGKKEKKEKNSNEDRSSGWKKYDVGGCRTTDDETQKTKQEPEKPRKRKVLRVHRKYQRL